MDFVTLGTTKITVNKNGFGALPIQRLTERDAVSLLRKAYENGITFFDTARFYTDSEKKIGAALSDVRDKIYLATKTMCKDADEFRKQLETSLNLLKTGYVDIYQFHNPAFCPKPGDGTGLYEAMSEAKNQGMVKHIGITNHRLSVAVEAAQSQLYEIIQFPVSYLASPDELDFVRLCAEKNIGVLAMKALAGGLITNSAAAYAFLLQFDNLLPIWGVQLERELDEFISYQNTPPVLDDTLMQLISEDKAALKGNFCRSCGYCEPCPAGIEIHQAARMRQVLRRAPRTFWDNENMRNNMKLVERCTNCEQCKEKCPYGLDTPTLLKYALTDYKTFVDIYYFGN